MKKITVLVLALGLTMPAYSWTLFPVREKIVTVKETNYAAMAGACAITLVASLIVGKVMFGRKEAKSRPALEAVVDIDIEPETVERTGFSGGIYTSEAIDIEPEAVERTDFGCGTYTPGANDDHVFMTVREYKTERACQRDAVICQVNNSLNPVGLHIQHVNGLWTLCMISGGPGGGKVYPIVRDCLTRLMAYIRGDFENESAGRCPIPRVIYVNMEDETGLNRHGVK
jgi:hypothetical protein